MWNPMLAQTFHGGGGSGGEGVGGVMEWGLFEFSDSRRACAILTVREEGMAQEQSMSSRER